MRFDIFHPETGFYCSCAITTTQPGGESRRHRHNCSEIRYVLKGNWHSGDRNLEPGDLGYFPESTYYGPQKYEEEVTHLGMHFAGPSPTSFYLPPDARERSWEELRASGVRVEGGVAMFPDGRKLDPSNATDARLGGGELEFAPPRYDEPIFIKTGNFPWRQTASRGVSTKHLAYFNDVGPNLTMLRLEPGAVAPGGHSVCVDMRVVLSGDVVYAGKKCPAVTRLYFAPGATFDEIGSQSGAEILVLQIAVPGGEAPPLHVV
jgi:hypothetical protein